VSKEKEKQPQKIKLASMKPVDYRLKDKEPGLFNPTDFVFIETNFSLILTVIASHGEVDLQDSYNAKLQKAITESVKSLEGNEVVVGFSLHSAFSASNIQDAGGLGIQLEDLDHIKPVIISMKDFNKLHPSMSPRKFVESKCVSH